MTPTQLASTATSLETAAGASTSANANIPGYWKRIAAASEALAGASTNASATLEGYMLRSAVALESIAGTSGAEENANRTGLLKRVVDALEVQAGAVTVGSLGGRLAIAAAAATFGPNLGPELVGENEFNASTGWTLAGNASISGGQLHLSTTQFSLGERATAGLDEAGAVYQVVVQVAQALNATRVQLGPNWNYGRWLSEILVVGENIFTSSVSDAQGVPYIQLVELGAPASETIIDSVSVKKFL